MSTISKRKMYTVPANDKYKFESEQTTTVRTLVEQLHIEGGYPDIIDNPSKYIMMWKYGNQGKETKYRIVSLDDIIYLPSGEFYFYCAEISNICTYEVAICTKTAMLKLDNVNDGGDNADFMASNTLYETIIFPPLIIDQAHLIKVISDQLGVDSSSIDGVYEDISTPVNITSPRIVMNDDYGDGFDDLYVTISHHDIVLKKLKDFEQMVKKMHESLEKYLIESSP